MAKKSGSGQGISAEQAMQAQKIMQMYSAQEQATQEAAKKKGKSLTDIVKSGFNQTLTTVKKLPGEHKERMFTGLDGILGSGIRSTATTYAIIATALPLALINPIGAALTAVTMGTYAFVASNTLYKLARDTAWIATYPIIRPIKAITTLPNYLTHPLATIEMFLKAPFKLVGGVFKYPFKVKRQKVYAYGPDGKNPAHEKAYTLNAGVNKYAALGGKLLGGYGAATALYGNILGQLKDVGSTAIETVKNTIAPKLAYAPR